MAVTGIGDPGGRATGWQPAGMNHPGYNCADVSLVKSKSGTVLSISFIIASKKVGNYMAIVRGKDETSGSRSLMF